MGRPAAAASSSGSIFGVSSVPHAGLRLALQARSGCPERYLGADATLCNNPRISLYSFTNVRALIKWQVARM